MDGFLWTLLIVAVVVETLLLLVAWQIWPQTASERQAGWRRTIAVLTLLLGNALLVGCLYLALIFATAIA